MATPRRRRRWEGQFMDASGTLRLTKVVPGLYPGRTRHPPA
ncbi:hypothetical protein [Streptomyces anatolicus]|nr:hypothetical protein [Streptomyces anatolicus]